MYRVGRDVLACLAMLDVRLPIGLFAMLGLASCGAPLIESCVSTSDLQVDCRFSNPEDLAVSPNGEALLVSEYGSLARDRSGRLVAYRPREVGGDGAIVPLFPIEGSVEAVAALNDPQRWGDPSCPRPTLSKFAPHGIDLERLDSGEWALYVVTHGERESIEMFEVLTEPSLALQWRGCVEGPSGSNFNDVIVLRGGGFWVSQTFPRERNTVLAGLRMRYLGDTPGFVYRWDRASGFSAIPATEVAYANGIEKSDDERFVFINAYFGNKLVKVDVERGERVGEVAVEGPDNVTWSAEGELLVASHLASTPDLLGCLNVTRGNCGFGFRILAIDPQRLTSRLLIEHRGPPMGAVTVALPFRGRLYLGTFAGDRIASR